MHWFLEKLNHPTQIVVRTLRLAEDEKHWLKIGSNFGWDAKQIVIQLEFIWMYVWRNLLSLEKSLDGIVFCSLYNAY